ncbi:MAG: M23 family metallopeptidase [Xanthomonadales bacterium]|nr:M23 family metallopeptidase [Xanthomonadales bacterium]
MRLRTLLIAVLAAVPTIAAAIPRTELPASTTPGALVIGRTEPGSIVTFSGRTLRVADDGNFLFGLGRDVSGQARIDVRYRDGTAQTLSIPIQPREFAIERVNGLPESTVNPDPKLAERIAREQAQVTKARERDDARQDYRFGFTWPNTGRISGVYGSQRILNGTPKNPHYGVDIAVGTGTPIHAPAGGVVSFVAKDLYLTGGTVVIDHGHGLSSVFVHMSRIDVKPEQRIEQGAVIGAVGATGRATGPHLHWGMNWFDTRLDPQLVVGPMPK